MFMKETIIIISNFRLIGRQVGVCFESSPSADKLIWGWEIPPPGGRVMKRIFQRFVLKRIVPLLLSLEGE